MERLEIMFGVALLVLFANETLATNNEDASLDRTVKGKSGQLWFDPRLGRRKRDPPAEGPYRGTAIEPEQLEALMEIIQESPWAIVAINEGKRQAVNFTPRLGRESGEEIFGGDVPNMGSDRWLQNSELTGELMSQRSPPFAPRLGKRVLPFSPRLGRENDRT